MTEAEQARAHAEALRNAVSLAGTRAEHIRLSILWAEADRLAVRLETA